MKRIYKPMARKMYDAGFNVTLLPCLVSQCALYVQRPWIHPVTITINTSEDKVNQFDRVVNSYEYYNCNSELGSYAAYYVDDGDMELYYHSTNKNKLEEIYYD